MSEDFGMATFRIDLINSYAKGEITSSADFKDVNIGGISGYGVELRWLTDLVLLNLIFKMQKVVVVSQVSREDSTTLLKTFISKLWNLC